MASSKPQCSTTPFEDSAVQVLDSNEPLVTSASSVPEDSAVQVLDSNEPLVTSASSVPSVSRVQVLDSVEPFVFGDTPPGAASPSGAAGPSGAACPSGAAGPSGAASPSGAAGPSGQASETSSSSDEDYVLSTGSSGRRVLYTADELRSQWSWQRLYKNLGTTEQCIQFAEERGLIPTEKLCTYHRRPMSLTREGAGQLGKFRCRKSNCRNKTVSRASGTWFENVKLPISVVFQLLFGYSDQATYHQIMREVAEGDGPVLSTATVADWYNYCREAVVVYELEHQDQAGKIGGPGKVVQIYESKFGKESITVDDILRATGCSE